MEFGLHCRISREPNGYCSFRPPGGPSSPARFGKALHKTLKDVFSKKKEQNKNKNKKNKKNKKKKEKEKK
jgi:hypothetical protein